MATAWMIALGHFWIAIVLLTLTGFHDLFDGPVAKASKRASQRGAFFDSVMDRVADSLILGGVAFYLTAHHRGQLVLLPFAILHDDLPDLVSTFEGREPRTRRQGRTHGARRADDPARHRSASPSRYSSPSLSGSCWR